jgi:hypothetical protein
MSSMFILKPFRQLHFYLSTISERIPISEITLQRFEKYLFFTPQLFYCDFDHGLTSVTGFSITVDYFKKNS